MLLPINTASGIAVAVLLLGLMIPSFSSDDARGLFADRHALRGGLLYKGRGMARFSSIASQFARQRRRLALPSALIGLVVFSFTLLGFGSIVYTAALPSLVAAAEQTSEGAYSRIVSGDMLGDLSLGASGGASDGSGSGVLPNVTLGNPNSGTAGLGNVDISSDVTADDGAGSDQDPSTPENPGQPGENPGGGSGGSEGGGGSGGSQNPPDPEREEQTYRLLQEKADALSGYMAQVNACVEDFNEDNLASMEVRLAHQRSCDALISRLFGEFTSLLNSPPVNGSRYGQAYGSLVGMYRCLTSYVSTISSAWTLNVAFDDPASHQDEFMKPIRDDTNSDGVNKHLAEFLKYYEDFEL